MLKLDRGEYAKDKGSFLSLFDKGLLTPGLC